MDLHNIVSWWKKTLKNHAMACAYVFTALAMKSLKSFGATNYLQKSHH